MATAAVRPAGAEITARYQAYRWLMLTFGFFLGAVVIGLGWDRAWHATHPFRDFFSPPHLFIYSMFALPMLSLARMCADAEIRACYGRPFRVPVVALPVPGPLAFAAAGLATIAIAGGLDLIWHTSFGLDETAWSLPHALLGWGILLASLGLICCRLALRESRPLAAYTPYVFAALLALETIGGPLGPFSANHSPDSVRAIFHLPVLAADRAAQHTLRIDVANNLTRTNPLFVLVSSLAAGAGLALVLGLFKRPRVLIVAAAIATFLTYSGELRTARFFGLNHDPKSFFPVPVLAAAIVYCGLKALRLPRPAAWAAAGFVFGLIETLVWGQAHGLALMAAPLMAGGALAGGWIARTIEAPNPRRLGQLFAVVAVGLPLLTGIIDLYLRTHTA